MQSLQQMITKKYSKIQSPKQVINHAEFKIRHYIQVEEINHLKDQKEDNKNQQEQQSVEQSSKNPVDYVADSLYKKILQNRFIRNPKQIVGHKVKQTQNFYDNSDKWIDDNDVQFAQPERVITEQRKFKCIQCASVQDFYSKYLPKKQPDSKQKQGVKRLPKQFNEEKLENLKKKIKTSMMLDRMQALQKMQKSIIKK